MHLFGIPRISLPTLSTSNGRLLKSANPEHVAAYNKAMIKYCVCHNMIDRIQQLYNSYKTMSLEAVRIALEKWDRDQGRAMNKAEAQFHTPPTKHPWSHSLRNAGVLKHCWRLRFRESLHDDNHSVTIDRLQQRTQSQDPSKAEAQFHTPPTKHPWSHSLRNAGVLKHYWRLRFRESLHDKNHSVTIDRLQQRTQSQDPTFCLPCKDDKHLSTEQIKIHLKLASKTLRTAQAESVDLRFKTCKALIFK